jgi:ribosomal protein L10
MNKLIINHDVLLRTPITKVRRQIKDDYSVKVFKNKL